MKNTHKLFISKHLVKEDKCPLFHGCGPMVSDMGKLKPILPVSLNATAPYIALSTEPFNVKRSVVIFTRIYTNLSKFFFKKRRIYTNVFAYIIWINLTIYIALHLNKHTLLFKSYKDFNDYSYIVRFYPLCQSLIKITNH